MENQHNSPFDRPSQVFRGIRFVLLGFDPINKPQVSRKLVNGGGIDVGQYGPNCTHVIADKLVYDDPICVAARRDGKILVSGLWADHSFDVGVPVDPTSVMYRPVRDLNGIPGAKSLVICLTGYQREDREDIMTMVELMGAQFSKPLIANKVTHLICYKFEGEKYLLAKKMKRIKLINHRWLEDCLKAWEIVSEADYSRSGYELEMEAEAKDSEDEAGGIAEVKKESPHHPLISKQDVSTSLPNGSASRVFKNADDMVSVTMKTTSDQFLNLQQNVTTGEPSNLFEGTSSGSVAKKSPLSEARNVISSIHSRKLPMETTPPTTDTLTNDKRPDKINLSNAFNMSSPLVETDDQNISSFGKRKMDISISCGSSKLQKESHNEDTLNRESLNVDSSFQEPPAEISNYLSPKTDMPYTKNRAAISPPQNSPSNSTGRTLLSSKGKSVTCDEPISKFSTSEIQQNKELDAEFKEASLVTKFGSSDVDMVHPECEKLQHVMEKSSPSGLGKSSTPNVETNELSGGSSSKLVRRKSIAKKFSAPKQNLGKKKTVNQKGSIFLQNSEPMNDTVDVQGVGGDKNLFNYQEVTKSDMEMQIENKSLGSMDDETEPPEDKEKHEDGGEQGPHTVDVVTEENANQNNEKDPISVNVDKHVSSQTSRGKKVLPTKKEKIKKKIKEVVSAKKKEDNNEIREEVTPIRASKRIKKNVNDLDTAEGGVSDKTEYSASEKDEEVQEGKSGDVENVIMNNKETKRNSKQVTNVNKKGKPTSSKAVKGCDLEAQKENMQDNRNKQAAKANSDPKKDDDDEPMWFILSGHKLQRLEFQQMIRRLKGKICRVSHQWSYQATHFIVPDPVRRTEKFFAAAASGSWILKMDYLSASNEAGKFLPEEPYEWHKNGLSQDGQINLEAPRKWRLLKEKTGHGAFHGMRILIYGECIAPTLDTLKRAVKAGDGTIVATSPPYTRFLNTGIDFAIVSPGMPHVDMWVQEFIRHEIPCVSADYLVEYVCKPGYPLQGHVLFDTNVWAENNLKNRLNEVSSEPATPESSDVACEVCGLRDRAEEMMICGNQSGSVGCGVGTHIDCCDPPFEDVPQEDWFCPKCNKPKTAISNSKNKKTSKRKAK